MTSETYYVRGNTALLDAIGRTIDKIGGVQQHTAPDEQAEKVLFVIITDGMENSSREYRYARVREMIERQKERYGWEFLFLGANIDAISVASRFGIAPDRAVTYCPDGEGTRLNYEAVVLRGRMRPRRPPRRQRLEKEHRRGSQKARKHAPLILFREAVDFKTNKQTARDTRAVCLLVFPYSGQTSMLRSLSG